MYTNDYTYEKRNAVKLIVENSEGNVLLIQEPESMEWMPLHWGLPGGKPTKNESLKETILRKIETDIGSEIDVLGIVSIEEILMKERTILMFILRAKSKTNEVSGQVNNYKWISKNDLEKIDISDFTEFYNKRLLTDFFENKLPSPIPLDLINTGEHYKLVNDPEYKKWIESGSKK